jgi:hypothetical protein
MAMMNVPVSCLSRADSRPRTSAADASGMAAAPYLHDSGFKTFKPFNRFAPFNSLTSFLPRVETVSQLIPGEERIVA